MSDLRDQIAEAMLPLYGDGVSGTREFQAGRMADAVLAVVEAHWCGCAWCCAGNAPGLQPGSAHDICTTNRRPEEDR